MIESKHQLIRDLLAALIQCRKCINHYGIVGDPASFLADAAIEQAEEAGYGTDKEASDGKANS